MNQDTIQAIADVVASAKREGRSEWSAACSVQSMLTKRDKWDTPITVAARRGDVAAGIQALGHANNLNDEAKRFKQSAQAALRAQERVS